MRCSNSECGKIGDGRFCGECGSKMIGEQTDNNLICCGKLEDGSPCGTVLFATQNFCKNCGTRVDDTLLKAVAENLNANRSKNFGDSEDEPLEQMNHDHITKVDNGEQMSIFCKQEAGVLVVIEPEVKVTNWSPQANGEIVDNGDNDVSDDDATRCDSDIQLDVPNDDTDCQMDDDDGDAPSDNTLEYNPGSDNEKQKTSKKRKVYKEKQKVVRRKKRKKEKRKQERPQVQRNKFGETPLHKACIKGDLDKVKELIKGGHPINVHDHSGWSPLHEAANNKWYDVAEYLLQHGADIDDKGGAECQGMTPLIDAASVGCLDIVELLLEYRANTAEEDNNEMTALAHLVKLHDEVSDEDEELESQFKSIVKIIEERMEDDKRKKRARQLEKSKLSKLKLKIETCNESLRVRPVSKRKSRSRHKFSRKRAVVESDSDSDSSNSSSSSSSSSSVDSESDGSNSTVLVDFSKDKDKKALSDDEPSTSTHHRFKSKRKKSNVTNGGTKLRNRHKPASPSQDRQKNSKTASKSPDRHQLKRKIRAESPPRRSNRRRPIRSESPPSYADVKDNRKADRPASQQRSKRITRSKTPPTCSDVTEKKKPGRPRGRPKAVQNSRALRRSRRNLVEEDCPDDLDLDLIKDSSNCRANGTSTSACSERNSDLKNDVEVSAAYIKHTRNVLNKSRVSKTNGIKQAVRVISDNDDDNVSSSTDIFKDSESNASDNEVPDVQPEYSDDSYLLAF